MKTRKIDEKIEKPQSSYSQLYLLENAQLSEEITKAISEHVKADDEDTTDRVFDVLSEIADSVQEEIEDLIGI